jgi:DNA-dependent metalloprotease WSS1
MAKMAEHDALVLSYSHLVEFPRASEALHTLKRVASLVKPIMRARAWKVGELAEFYPDQANLLGGLMKKIFCCSSPQNVAYRYFIF